MRDPPVAIANRPDSIAERAPGVVMPAPRRGAKATKGCERFEPVRTGANGAWNPVHVSHPSVLAAVRPGLWPIGRLSGFPRTGSLGQDAAPGGTANAARQSRCARRCHIASGPNCKGRFDHARGRAPPDCPRSPDPHRMATKSASISRTHPKAVATSLRGCALIAQRRLFRVDVRPGCPNCRRTPGRPFAIPRLDHEAARVAHHTHLAEERHETERRPAHQGA